jgi:hypothetical protein
MRHHRARTEQTEDDLNPPTTNYETAQQRSSASYSLHCQRCRTKMSNRSNLTDHHAAR